MRKRHRQAFIWPILLASCGAIPCGAGDTATITNQSGNDLFVTRAGTKAACPILVTAKGGEGLPPSKLCPPPSPGGISDDADPFGLVAPSAYRYLLKNGKAATFQFEAQGKDQEAELVLYRLDQDQGLSCYGIVIFSVAHKPSPLPDGLPEPEARLTLPGGPTPRTRALPCNRKLRMDSPTDLKVLP